MKRLCVILLLVCGAVTWGDRPPSHRVLKGSLAPSATRPHVVVVRDATGRPIGYRVFTPNR